MAKLYFRYGAMNSGKSTGLLQTAYNYEERDQRVLLLKAVVDTKGEDSVVSRLGVSRRVDLLTDADDDLRALVRQRALAGAQAVSEGDGGRQEETVSLREVLDCVLIDEAQFLSPLQVDQLMEIVLVDDVVTTGATLGACARAIEEAGGRVLGALAMAAAPPPKRRYLTVPAGTAARGAAAASTRIQGSGKDRDDRSGAGLSACGDQEAPTGDDALEKEA